MRFSELEGARVGVWGAGREIISFAEQLARRLPSARIVVAAFDTPPEQDVRETLRAPGARVVIADADAVAPTALALQRRQRRGCRRETADAEASRRSQALSGCDVIVRSPGCPCTDRSCARYGRLGYR